MGWRGSSTLLEKHDCAQICSPVRSWKCETKTQATVQSTDLGLISIKEIVNDVGGNMNAEGEHKEKMVTDRTLGGSLSVFRGGKISPNRNSQ